MTQLCEKDRGNIEATWSCCPGVLGWMMASPQIVTLSWSDGQRASSWCSSTDTTPEQMRWITDIFNITFTIKGNGQHSKPPDLYETPAAPHSCLSSGTDVPDFEVNSQPNCLRYKNRTCSLGDLWKSDEDDNTIRLHRWAGPDWELAKLAPHYRAAWCCWWCGTSAAVPGCLTPSGWHQIKAIQWHFFPGDIHSLFVEPEEWNM